MIKEIIALLEKYKESIRFETDGTLDIRKINVSKFSHADQKPYRKVLFLVTYNNIPKLILKIMRSPEYNEHLRKEAQNEKKAALDIHDFYIPKVLCEDMIRDLFVYGEEVIVGEPFQPQDSAILLPKVFIYQKNIPKIKTVQSDIFIDILDHLHIQDCHEYDIARRELEMYRGLEIYIGLNHGDMTVRNFIVNSEGKLALIDWENYGDKVVWGIDAMHFFIRAKNILFSSEEFKKYKDKCAEVYANLDSNYSGFVYVMDWIYDIFQKDLPTSYYKSFLEETKKRI